MFYARKSLALCLFLPFLLCACPNSENKETEPKSSSSPIQQVRATPQPIAFTLFATSLESLQPIARYLPENQSFEPVLPEQDLSQTEAIQINTNLLTQNIPLNVVYPVFQNGLKLGAFQPERLEALGCGDAPEIIGQWKPALQRKVKPEDRAIGYAPVLNDLPTLKLPKPLDAITLAELGEALKAQFFQERGMSTRVNEFGLNATHGFPFQKHSGAPIIQGLFIQGHSNAPIHPTQCGKESYWVLALLEAGKPVIFASYLQPSSDYPEDCQSSDFISSFVVGQTLNHILIQHHAYESSDYSIYAWRGQSLKKVFQGGRSGC